jgi:hypothetical protein
MSISDAKLKLCAVVKLKRNEVDKEPSKSGHSTVRKDVSTSDNLPPSSRNSNCRLFESFSFIDRLLELQSHDSVANFTEDLLQPQLPNHFTFKNIYRKDSLNDSVLTSEKVNVISSNEILEQTPINEGANVANSDSDKEALYQVMKLLNIPKRTVTTQVDLVEDILQGSEAVAAENETENRYTDLVSVLQRVILHLPKYENPI